MTKNTRSNNYIQLHLSKHLGNDPITLETIDAKNTIDTITFVASERQFDELSKPRQIEFIQKLVDGGFVFCEPCVQFVELVREEKQMVVQSLIENLEAVSFLRSYITGDQIEFSKLSKEEKHAFIQILVDNIDKEIRFLTSYDIKQIRIQFIQCMSVSSAYDIMFKQNKNVNPLTRNSFSLNDRNRVEFRFINQSILKEKYSLENLHLLFDIYLQNRTTNTHVYKILQCHLTSHTMLPNFYNVNRVEAEQFLRENKNMTWIIRNSSYDKLLSNVSGLTDFGLDEKGDPYSMMTKIAISHKKSDGNIVHILMWKSFSDAYYDHMHLPYVTFMDVFHKSFVHKTRLTLQS
jgi:hypothetical protein